MDIIINKITKKQYRIQYLPLLTLKVKSRERKLKKAVLLLGMSITIPTVSIAQENIETDISADLVSGYIWRGQDLGNVSIQPTLSVSYKGFSLSAWGSVGFEGKTPKNLTSH